MSVEDKLKFLRELKSRASENQQKMAIAIDSIRLQIQQNPKTQYTLNDINKYFDKIKEDTSKVIDAFGQESTKTLLAISQGVKIETKAVNPVDALSISELEHIQEQINTFIQQYMKIIQSFLDQAIELGIRERDLVDLEKF